ncbi:hypothetical protein JZ751_019442 [Albula glossodonta]|uniref:LRP chaperone MESD n=1 Tax=Albula glossodonta TaxID=121402 RepID=A0A8T2NUY6_9TELE|nr:hypothetical protein JZ751_019442 [Albula glossodonta]
MALCYKWSLTTVANAADDSKNKKPKKKKDIRDYNDADMARLLEEWEKDDDIEEGDLPEHRRAPPSVDISKIDPSKPEEVLKMMKKGRTLMVFATVSGNPRKRETEDITGLWHTSLFVVGSNRVVFMLRDGSFAWEIKDFLVAQDRCADVMVEGQVYPGKAVTEKNDKAEDKERNEINPKKRGKKSEKEEIIIENNRANKAREDL